MGNKFRKAIGDLREPDFPSKEYLLCKVQKGRGRGGAGALRPVPCHSPLASLNACGTEFLVESYGFR